MPRLFEYEGRYFIETGMIQLKNAGLLAPGSRVWDEPANFSKEVNDWLKEHNSKGFDNAITGSPTFEFPSSDIRAEFCKHFSFNADEDEDDTRWGEQLPKMLKPVVKISMVTRLDGGMMPQFWVRFLTYVESIWDPSVGVDSVLERELAEIGLTHDPYQDLVFFENDEEMTEFLMRWG